MGNRASASASATVRKIFPKRKDLVSADVTFFVLHLNSHKKPPSGRGDREEVASYNRNDLTLLFDHIQKSRIFFLGLLLTGGVQ